MTAASPTPLPLVPHRLAGRWGRGYATRMKRAARPGSKSVYDPFEEREVGSAPDIEALRSDWTDAVDNRDTGVLRRQQVNYRTRYCKWRNQDWSGKKWSADAGAEVVPWKGASDVRVPMVDLFVRQDVARLMVAWARMRTAVNPVESNDAAAAARLTNFMRWMRYTQIPEMRHEMRLLANYFCERGNAVLGVFWERRVQNGYEELTLESLKDAALQAQARQFAAAQMGAPEDPTLETQANLPEMILDPMAEAEAAAALAALYPQTPAGAITKAVRDLRTTGTARIVVPYARVNRPSYVALSPNDDIFLPPEATDIQTARFVARVEHLSETQLVERHFSTQWDKDWVKQVVTTQRGRVTGEVASGALSRRNNESNAISWNQRDLFEVVHDYRWLHDANGVPGIYYTCYSPGITDQYAYRSLLNYEHGEMPFTLFDLETRSRLVDDSRGTGERIFTLQNIVKGEFDAEIDRASVATVPPMHYPEGAPPSDWGPGGKIATLHADEYGWFQPPRYDPGSEKVIAQARMFAAEYMGRPTAPENEEDARNLKQELLDHWMDCTKRADSQSLKLCQQFMPDEFYYRVVGSQSKPIHARREDIQGNFDMGLYFNGADLDPELLAEKIKLIREALLMDVNAVTDRTASLQAVFNLVDPNLGELLIRDPQESAQAEVEDEDAVLSRMATGIGTDIRPGQNYAMRLQRLNKRLLGTPKLKQQYLADEGFRELVDNRIAQLQQQLQQQDNALTGKLGSESVDLNL
jgi:hypothetical protein